MTHHLMVAQSAGRSDKFDVAAAIRRLFHWLLTPTRPCGCQRVACHRCISARNVIRLPACHFILRWRVSLLPAHGSTSCSRCHDIVSIQA